MPASQSLTDAPAPGSVSPGTTRHPRGLSTLFFTEMWERFSYYGMRALLVLFMVDAVRGGMGMSDKVATAIYGIYTSSVYLMSLPGGWLGDRLLGAQRAVWCGGLIIAFGHFTLAFSRTETFYAGLVLVVIGSGMLKPNISAVVAELYPEGGARRDAGFTIFYMGVNLGAALGPLVCSTLGEKANWHYGFGAAGIGMVLGLVQFRLTRHRLGGAGAQRANVQPLGLLPRAVLGVIAAGLALTAALALSGRWHPDPVALAQAMTTVIVGVGVVFFAGLFLLGKLDASEKRRVGMIVILFLASALFWAGFEQAGSSFNLFADRYTDRTLACLNFLLPAHRHNYVVPAGWYQSLGALFIIVFAPVFAALWVRLARRNLDPATPVKFGFGLFFLAAGFLVMAFAARVVSGGAKAQPVWLLATYLLHTFGELCLSPVGLSSVTKLAPRRLVGQLMGAWFLATSLGNLIAGLLAGEFKADRILAWPGMYLRLLLIPVLAGVLLLALARPIQRWVGNRAEPPTA